MARQDSLNDLIKTSVAPLLKGHGFKKSGNNFYKELGDFALCFNVQSSRWNNAQEVDFTLNTGIFVPQVFSIFNNESVPKFPKEIDCILRNRIGDLKEAKTDTWYKLNEKTSIHSVELKLIDDIDNFILPHFSKHCTLEAVLESVLEPDHYEAPMKIAILLYAMGRKDECSRVIQESYKASTEGQRAFIQEIAERLCIKVLT